MDKPSFPSYPSPHLHLPSILRQPDFICWLCRHEIEVSPRPALADDPVLHLSLPWHRPSLCRIIASSPKETHISGIGCRLTPNYHDFYSPPGTTLPPYPVVFSVPPYGHQDITSPDPADALHKAELVTITGPVYTRHAWTFRVHADCWDVAAARASCSPSSREMVALATTWARALAALNWDFVPFFEASQNDGRLELPRLLLDPVGKKQQQKRVRYPRGVSTQCPETFDALALDLGVGTNNTVSEMVKPEDYRLVFPPHPRGSGPTAAPVWNLELSPVRGPGRRVFTFPPSGPGPRGRRPRLEGGSGLPNIGAVMATRQTQIRPPQLSPQEPALPPSMARDPRGCPPQSESPGQEQPLSPTRPQPEHQPPAQTPPAQTPPAQTPPSASPMPHGTPPQAQPLSPPKPLLPFKHQPPNDVFALLPPELLHPILILLPTSSITSLRLASRAVASLTADAATALPRRFWRSRFGVSFEMGFALPLDCSSSFSSSLSSCTGGLVDKDDENMHRDWQGLYFGLKQAMDRFQFPPSQPPSPSLPLAPNPKIINISKSAGKKPVLCPPPTREKATLIASLAKRKHHWDRFSPLVILCQTWCDLPLSGHAFDWVTDVSCDVLSGASTPNGTNTNQIILREPSSLALASRLHRRDGLPRLGVETVCLPLDEGATGVGVSVVDLGGEKYISGLRVLSRRLGHELKLGYVVHELETVVDFHPGERWTGLRVRVDGDGVRAVKVVSATPMGRLHVSSWIGGGGEGGDGLGETVEGMVQVQGGLGKGWAVLGGFDYFRMVAIALTEVV